MSQSLARVAVHAIFSTKHREPLIGHEARPDLCAYLAGALNAIDCPALRVGGTADHVHLLFVLSKTVALATAIEEVKKESSKWAKARVHPRFFWQAGYGAFSVSASQEETVVAYIENQEKHHAKRTFKDELVAFFVKHRMKYDEAHMWD
jgi:REP element-mobilizing transposase RayT